MEIEAEIGGNIIFAFAKIVLRPSKKSFERLVAGACESDGLSDSGGVVLDGDKSGAFAGGCGSEDHGDVARGIGRESCACCASCGGAESEITLDGNCRESERRSADVFERDSFCGA